MMDKIECVLINAPRPMTGGTQKIVVKKGVQQESTSTITEEDQDEDDDEYYLYDEDPPPYDISEKLKEINSALSRETIPQGYEERQRKVIFRENPVEIEIPPTPNYSTDDEDDGYGDSTETSDDLTDQIANDSGLKITDANKSPQNLEFANKQKFCVDLSQLLGPARGPPTSSPNSVAEEINFLFQCFTKLSLQNNASQPVQTQITEAAHLPNSPAINENEPFLLDSHDVEIEHHEEPSAISTDSLDVPGSSFEESSHDNSHLSHQDRSPSIHQDSHLQNTQSEPGLPNDNQSKRDEDVEKLIEHSKAEEKLEKTGEIGETSQLATISQNASELSEYPPSGHTYTDISTDTSVEVHVQPTESSLHLPRNGKPKDKCSTTQALMKWKRAMRQLHNVRQVKHRPSSQSRSTCSESNAEIQTEIEQEIFTSATCSKLDAARPVTCKPSMEATCRNDGHMKKKLLLTRSSASSTTLFPEKKSTNFEETMVMASQGKFRMMKTEDFRSSASKLSENQPRHVKMAAGRATTSVSRRPENKAKITPNTNQPYQRNMGNSSVKSKTLTLSQYPSPYRPLSVNWNKEERFENIQRQRHLRGFSGTTFRLTPEQKAEKERKLQAIAQERQQKLERARQEKLKRKQEVEIAFKDWLRCKKMQEPNSKKPSIEEEETERNMKHHRHAENSGSPAFQDWLKRKKMQKLEELKIAEIKRKVEEKMLYIRKNEDNEKAFKKWLQTKNRESNLSSLRRKSSAANHFGSMSKWRTDHFFANYREF